MTRSRSARAITHGDGSIYTLFVVADDRLHTRQRDWHFNVRIPVSDMRATFDILRKSGLSDAGYITAWRFRPPGLAGLVRAPRRRSRLRSNFGLAQRAWRPAAAPISGDQRSLGSGPGAALVRERPERARPVSCSSAHADRARDVAVLSEPMTSTAGLAGDQPKRALELARSERPLCHSQQAQDPFVNCAGRAQARMAVQWRVLIHAHPEDSFLGERATVRVRKVDRHCRVQTDSRTTAGRSLGRGITSCVRRRCLVPRRNHAFAGVEGATSAVFLVAIPCQLLAGSKAHAPLRSASCGERRWRNKKANSTTTVQAPLECRCHIPRSMWTDLGPRR